MSTFKVGDKVLCLYPGPIGRTKVTGLEKGRVYIVTATSPTAMISVFGISGFFYVEQFVIFIPEEVKTEHAAAVALLVKAGYTVTPPPEKKSGIVYVTVYAGTHFAFFTKQTWESLRPVEQGKYKVLAVVPWIEGDDLPLET